MIPNAQNELVKYHTFMPYYIEGTIYTLVFKSFQNKNLMVVQNVPNYMV